MTGVTLKIDFETEALGQALASLRRQAENPRPALAEIGEYLLEATEDRFAAQVDPAGRPWAPLSPRYRKKKRRHQDLILVLDGYLKGTFPYRDVGGRAASGTKAEAKRVSASRLEIGSNRVYAATHQLGDPARNIPARPFLGLAGADKAEMLQILEDHLRS